MLEEALTALASAGGVAVVQAAGTDGWAAARQALAHWFGRGDRQREHTALERLDRTSVELETADAAMAEEVRTHQRAMWQARIEALMEGMNEADRTEAAEELRALLTRRTTGPGVMADNGSWAVGEGLAVTASGAGAVAVGGNVTGSVAANGPPADSGGEASSPPREPGLNAS